MDFYTVFVSKYVQEVLLQNLHQPDIWKQLLLLYFWKNQVQENP